VDRRRHPTRVVEGEPAPEVPLRLLPIDAAPTRLADVAVEVVPAPVDPQEAAVFALDSAFAV
jgi:hypothetical protein